MPEPESRTLVILHSEGSALEPYHGSHPGDGTWVFTRHPDETPWLMDLRLRSNLTQAPPARKPRAAVIVCAQNSDPRAIRRQVTLLARQLGPGAALALSGEPWLEQLASELRRETSALRVTIQVFQHARPTPSESQAPMTAAWERLQARRSHVSAIPSATSGASCAVTWELAV